MIKKHILLIVGIVLLISCNTNAQENKAYEVLNDILNTIIENKDTKLKVSIKKYPTNKKLKAELDDPIHINPKFSYLLVSMSGNTILKSPDIKNDFWVIDYIPVLRNCSKKFQIEDLQLIKDSTYYINQIKKTPRTLDISKITNKRIHHYKTELKTYNNIKQYEHLQEKGIDSIKLQEEKESMLIKENKHFQVSYPIFSKDSKYALVYVESIRLGGQLWILKKEDGKWKKTCVSQILIIC